MLASSVSRKSLFFIVSPVVQLSMSNLSSRVCGVTWKPYLSLAADDEVQDMARVRAPALSIELFTVATAPHFLRDIPHPTSAFEILFTGYERKAQVIDQTLRLLR